MLGLFGTVFIGVLAFMFNRLYKQLDKLEVTLSKLSSCVTRMEEHEKLVDMRFDDHDRRIGKLEGN